MGGYRDDISCREIIPSFLRHWLVSRTLVASLGLICYVNSCSGDFVFDDSEAILNNKDIDPGASSITDVFSHDFWGGNITSKTSHKSYRPLTILTFRLNFMMAGGRHPFFFHLTNVLLHPLVCLLLLEVINSWWHHFNFINQTVSKYTASKCISSVALIAAILFAVHPIHTESVSGVVGRAELTSALCFMMALLTYPISFKQEQGIRRTFISLLSTIVLAALAMLCKEQGVTVLGICAVSEIVFCVALIQIQWHSRKIASMNETWTRMKCVGGRLLILCIAVILLVWGRFIIMATGAPQFTSIDNPASFADSWITRTLSYNYIYFINWWLLFHPWWLCFDWSMGCIPLVQSFDLRIIVVLLLWVSLGGLSLWTLCNLKTRRGRMTALSLCLLVIPFLPASNLLFRVGFVVAERVLYISSAGHCILVAIGAITAARHSPLMKRIVQFFLIYLVAVHTMRSVQCFLALILHFRKKRSTDWLTEESLFISGLQVCPSNAKVHYNVGKMLSDRGLITEAENSYREAIRLYPEYDQALNNLANLIKDSNRLDEAEMYLERALKSNNKFAAAWMNLGIVQSALNKTKEAEESYKKAITHRRKYPDAYYNMGNLYIDTGQASEAISAFSMAISQEPLHTNAWTNLGLLYEDLGMYKEAETVMKEAIALMPDKARFYFSLGVLLGKTQRLEEGEMYLSSAVEMRPDIAKYHVNLGVIYHMQKRYDLAEKHYTTAIQLEPNLSSAKDNLRKLHSTLSKLH